VARHTLCYALTCTLSTHHRMTPFTAHHPFVRQVKSTKCGSTCFVSPAIGFNVSPVLPQWVQERFGALKQHALRRELHCSCRVSRHRLCQRKSAIANSQECVQKLQSTCLVHAVWSCWKAQILHQCKKMGVQKLWAREHNGQ